MIGKISFVLLAVALSGCGQATQHFMANQTNVAQVSFNVTLEKPFIAANSSLGGGQVVMLILVGPFTNNAILLVGKEVTESEERIAFRERLKWGQNTFDVPLNRNTKYQLSVVVQGTRTGTKEIGSIQTKAGSFQYFVIHLLETGSKIEAGI